MKIKLLIWIFCVAGLSTACHREVPADELAAMEADLHKWESYAAQALDQAESRSESIPQYARYQLMDSRDTLSQTQLRARLAGEARAGESWVDAAGLQLLVREAGAFLRQQYENPVPRERRARRWAWLGKQIMGSSLAQ